MYLLSAYACSWLALLGTFCAAWTQLSQPRTASDLVVITIVGAATLAFARHGLVSLVTLLLRMLPAGRIRSGLAAVVLRVMPRLLASSVLAVVSAGLAAQAVHALPTPTSEGDVPATTTQVSIERSVAADPGWPTTEDRDSDVDLANPAWPTEPPEDRSAPARPVPKNPNADGQPTHHPETPRDSRPKPSPSTKPESCGPRGGHPADCGTGSERRSRSPETHVVVTGESLWSIAAGLAAAEEDIPQLVDDIYAANREVIGPDPSLIISGQRLETQP